VTETCGPKSHTAILARSLGVPMLTDVGRVTEQIADGTDIFVDATDAKVYTGDDIKRTATPAAEPASECVRVPTPATTADDVRITLLLSISDSAESAVVRKLGADGVGLWRTEFLFMGRTHWPSEEEIYEELRKVAAHIGDTELNIRLADFGAEKCPIYADIPVNRNPSLGLRGLRLLLQREDILRPQLGAIVALARQRPVTLLLPMLDSVDTLEMATDRFCRIAGCRGRRTLPFQLGAMVEMPSAALMVADILDEVDAVSIGLNDLTQYTLAADRDDELVEAYHDPMHPAVIRLLRQIIETAAAKSKLVTACGDLTGDIQTMALLLTLGFRRFSVSQVDFPKLALALPNISVRSLAPLAAELETLRSPKAVRRRVAERLNVTPGAGA
jgi:phosphotransferase system enzyme I (PtsI)